LPANQNNIFRHNISSNDANKTGASALYAFGGTNNVYHNNTVYLNSAALISGGPSAVGVDTGSASASFVNNIFQTVGAFVPHIGAGTIGTAIFVGNDYYSTGTAFSLFGYSSLAAWIGSGQETLDGIVYGLNADPQLLNPPSGTHAPLLPANQVSTMTDFDVQGTSPTINAGVNPFFVGINSGATDFHGYPNRTGVPVGIGACIYGAANLDPKQGGSGGGNPIIG
jgi:hypothetical protein